MPPVRTSGCEPSKPGSSTPQEPVTGRREIARGTPREDFALRTALCAGGRSAVPVASSQLALVLSAHAALLRASDRNPRTLFLFGCSSALCAAHHAQRGDGN
ncbi:unnamed protein product [Cutaneotrichosporon oleaginosum]